MSEQKVEPPARSKSGRSIRSEVESGGWREFGAPRLNEAGGSFVSGDPEGDRLRVRYFQREGEPRLVGRAWFGPGAGGPPGHAHGGSVAAVLDEAMGGAAWLARLPSIAARLETDFVRPVPLETELWFDARVDRVEDNKIWLAARLMIEDVLYARGRALFIKLDPSRYREMAEVLARSRGQTVEEFFTDPDWS